MDNFKLQTGVLMVEDEEDTASLLKFLLGRPAYQVVHAKDGSEPGSSSIPSRLRTSCCWTSCCRSGLVAGLTVIRKREGGKSPDRRIDGDGERA